MTAIAGGAADKAGNAYEHLWTAFRLAQVMSGEASTLTPEPVGSAGTGVEFIVEQAGVSWCEQAKDEAHSWTRRGMEARGILSVARTHIEAGHNFRFVVSTNAEMMQTLTQRARATATLAEFEESLNAERLPEFAHIANHWQVPRETAHTFLQRLYIDQHTPEGLSLLVQRTFSLLTSAEPNAVIALLRLFVDDHVHQHITGAQLWSFLESHGIHKRLIVGDANVLHALRRTRDALSRRVSNTSSAIARVQRPEVEDLCTALKDPTGVAVHVCVGAAGSGKSTVVSEVVDKLTEQGWEAAAIRLDVVDSRVQTARLLGLANGLPDSPAVVLANIGENLSTLLVVDQLDAVSLYGGRMPEAFASVADLLGEAALVRGLRVLLVTREVDLGRDSRLAQLVGQDERARKWTIGHLSEADVKRALEDADIDPAVVDARTASLLRVPLHLGIFGALSRDAQTVPYRSLLELYEQFVIDRRVAVESDVGSFDWFRLTDALVQHMSNNETITAAIEVLDPFSPRVVAALESQGVLVRDGRRVGFFHESFFDYLFARSFVSTGEGLLSFLDRSGQQLFRRAQVRQVLEYLEQSDRPTFIRSARELLESPNVRSHLKDVVFAVLRRSQATAEDWESFEDLAWSDAFVGRQLRSLLASPAWFDSADSLARWEGWLTDDARLEGVYGALLTAARERPARVSALLRPFMSRSEEWDRRLAAFAQWVATPEMVPFLVELAGTGALDEVRGPIAINSDFWSIVYGLAEESPASAAGLIGAYLARQQDRAEASGAPDPFSAELISRHSSAGGDDVITRTAEGAPAEYADNVLPFVLRVARRDNDAWKYRHLGNLGVDDAVFSGLESSLNALAASGDGTVEPYLQRLLAEPGEAIRFLACRVFSAGDEPNRAIEWLVTDEANLDLGWMDAPNWATRELVTKASRDCDDEHFAQLVDAIINFVTPWEKRATPYSLEARGWNEYCLLTALDPTRITDRVRKRIAELSRKFAPAFPHGPEQMRFEAEAPLISPKAAAAMRDEHWIRAIQKYAVANDEGSPWPEGRNFRAVLEAMSTRARTDPDRFAALVLDASASIPVAALTEVLTATASSLSEDRFEQLVRRVDSLGGPPHRRQVLRAITDRATYAPIPAGVVQIMCSFVSDPDPVPTSDDYEVPADERKDYDGPFTKGLNSTRGSLATTLEALLRQSSEHRATVLPTIEQLAVDASLAVRMCAPEPVLALHDREDPTWMNIAFDLFTMGSEVLASPYAAQLLFNCLLVQPERFLPFVLEAVNTPPSQSHAGELWALSALRGHFDALPEDLATLDERVRKGAASQFAKSPQEAMPFLLALFEDPSAEVRKSAAMAVRRIHTIPSAVATHLLEAFIDSPAFDGEASILMHVLAEPQVALPGPSINACRRAIDLAGSDLGDIRTSRAAMSSDLATVLLAIYKTGSPELRQAALGEIDRLIELGSYGLAHALNAEIERS